MMCVCVGCREETVHHAKGRCCNCYQKHKYATTPLMRAKQKLYRENYDQVPEHKKHNRDYMRNYMRERLKIKKENWRKD